jgi:hypothetical protein
MGEVYCNMPKHIQGKDGRMAGSIGDGQNKVPTGQPLDRTVLLGVVMNAQPDITLEDLYTAYVARQAKLAADEAAREAANAERQRIAAERAAFWKTFVPTSGAIVAAGYESHYHLPVGTVVTLRNSTQSDGYWNGSRWVKTSESTWTGLRSDGYDQALKALKGQKGGISPCPRFDGDWVIETVLEP